MSRNKLWHSVQGTFITWNHIFGKPQNELLQLHFGKSCKVSLIGQSQQMPRAENQRLPEWGEPNDLMTIYLYIFMLWSFLTWSHVSFQCLSSALHLNLKALNSCLVPSFPTSSLSLPPQVPSVVIKLPVFCSSRSQLWSFTHISPLLGIHSLHLPTSPTSTFPSKHCQIATSSIKPSARQVPATLQSCVWPCGNICRR